MTLLTSLFEHPYTLATSYAATVVDQDGTRTITLNPSGTLWYAGLLSPSGATGASALSPLSLLDALGSALGSTRWNVSVGADGRPTIYRLPLGGPIPADGASGRSQDQLHHPGRCAHADAVRDLR